MTPPAAAPHTDDRISNWVARRLDAIMTALLSDRGEDAYAAADAVMQRFPAAIDSLEIVVHYAETRRDWQRVVLHRAAKVAAFPDDRDARASLVRAQLNAGSAEAADSLASGLYADDPSRPACALLKLETLIAAEPGAVLAWSETAMSRLDLTESLCVDIVQMLARAQLHEPARAWLDRAFACCGRTDALARAEATLAFREGRLDEAEALWVPLSESGSDSVRLAAFLHRGRIAAAQDRRADAYAHFREALAADPANEEAVRNVIQGACDVGCLEDAGRAFESFEDAVGSDPAVARMRASLRLAQRDFPAAAAAFEDGIAAFPADLQLRWRFADALVDEGDAPAASRVLDAGLRLCPNDPELLIRRVRIGRSLGDDARGLLALVDRSLAQQPRDEPMLRQKAGLHLRLGQRRHHVEALLAALALDPGQLGSWQGAVSGLRVLNDDGGVSGLVARARQVFAGEALHDRLSLAQILDSAGRTDEALDLAERAVEGAPEDAEARLVTARLLDAAGLYRRAWPHLSAMRSFHDPPASAAPMFERVTDALRYVDANPLDGAERDLFPAALFARIAHNAVPHDPGACGNTVLHVNSGLTAGGAERQLVEALRALAADGRIAPELAGIDFNPELRRDFFLAPVQSAGIPITELAAMRTDGRMLRAFEEDVAARADVALLSSLPSDLANVALPLYAVLRAKRPRVVQLWQDSMNVAGGIAAMVAGVPRIVLGTRSTRPVDRRRARPYLAAGYHALLAYPGTVLLNNSRYGAEDYAAWLQVDPSRIETLHNGYDFDAIRAKADPDLSARIRTRLNAGPGHVVIGGVMRWSAEKRPDLWLDTVIALASQDARVRGLLVGDGPMRAALEARLRQSGLSDRIELAGRQRPVEPWMRAMDVLLLSSTTEGLPNVLIEAQALGIAVATTRVGGAQETVVEGVTGIVLEDDSAASIAAALQPLVEDSERRGRMGSAGPAWAQQTFGIGHCVESLIAIYDRAPQPPRARA